MSNNDLDNDLDVDFDDAGGFDDYSKKGSLGDLWRNNPMVKIGIILACCAIVIGAIILFGTSDPTLPISQTSDASDVNEAPGSSEISSTMQQAIEDKNLENAERALQTNQSAMPIPVTTGRGTLPITVEETPTEDPLERWRKMQDERIRQQETLQQAQVQQPQGSQPPPVDTRTPAVNALSESMVAQMQGVLQNQGGPKIAFKSITGVNYLEDLEKKKFASIQEQQRVTDRDNGGVDDEDIEDIIIPAGTIEYGQLLLEANTEAPGPVLAQIVSGPLKGGRVLGSFQSTEEYLVLNFNTVVIDGVDYPVQAVAIDPDTTLPGLITDIDHRYFKRIILPMAADFVSGLANAVSDSGTTSVFIADGSVTQSTEDKTSKEEVASGIGSAGETLSEILNDEAERTKPILRVAGGTPVGILFVEPVIEDLATHR